MWKMVMTSKLFDDLYMILHVFLLLDGAICTANSSLSNKQLMEGTGIGEYNRSQICRWILYLMKVVAYLLGLEQSCILSSRNIDLINHTFKFTYYLLSDLDWVSIGE